MGYDNWALYKDSADTLNEYNKIIFISIYNLI